MPILFLLGLVVGWGGSTLYQKTLSDTFVRERPIHLAVDTLRAIHAPSSSEILSPVQLNALFKEAARHAREAVVFIEVETPERIEIPNDRFHNFDEDMLRRFFRRRYRRSAGSGVIIDSRGYIVTNHHVVEDARSIHVMLSDRREFEARLIGSDPTTDLAVIQIPTQEGLHVMPFGNSDSVEVGEWVLAVGNPFRLTATVTAGIVSAVGRQVGIISDSLRIEDFIQTDAAINPGNSGGALVNLWGELVGINTAIATERGTYEGYGFAIPVNLVHRVVGDLIAYGEVRRGYLGVEITAVTAPLARQLGLPEVRGVQIVRVLPGSSADRAGLKEGDVVLEVDGHPVDAPNQLQRRVALRRPGENVQLMVWRNGRVFTVEAELMGREAPPLRQWRLSNREEEALPEEAPSSSIIEVPGLGLGLKALSPEEREAFGVREGVYIAYVRSGSPAAHAGVPRDVVLLAVNDQPVASIEDALRLFEQDSTSFLLEVVRRDGYRAFYEVLLEAVQSP